ncbi:uncharacterized protein [Haliotis asinina]|uniref:uncharacterized protein n=1 Tax=Haliotis asinina TaxID=109174 RepID=UPI003531C96A
MAKSNTGADDFGEPSLKCPFLSRTKRLGIRLNDAGFTYFRERCRGEVTYWRCTNKRCKGRIVQKWQSVTRTQSHNHVPSGLPCDPSDSFVANVRLSAHPNDKTVRHQETEELNSGMSDDSSPEISHPVPILVWEKEEEEELPEIVEEDEEVEEIDVKPDINELERSLYQHNEITNDKGVSTEPDNLLAENTWLKMRVQKLEMELQRYKDTVSRIRADLDILNMV